MVCVYRETLVPSKLESMSGAMTVADCELAFRLDDLLSETWQSLGLNLVSAIHPDKGSWMQKVE